MEEVHARDGMLIAITHPNDRAAAAKAEHVIEVPATAELLAPLAAMSISPATWPRASRSSRATRDATGRRGAGGRTKCVYERK